MGVADLRQPRLRSDFSASDWVQHLLRYHIGHFLSPLRGHRVVWARHCGPSLPLTKFQTSGGFSVSQLSGLLSIFHTITWRRSTVSTRPAHPVLPPCYPTSFTKVPLTLCRTSPSRTGAWVLENPDLVRQIHAFRVELLLSEVLRFVVPASNAEPFLYWLCFEFGKNGNPHAHGQCYVACWQPPFEAVLEDERARAPLKTAGRRDVDFLPTWDEAEAHLAAFFQPFIMKTHPCKDAESHRRYDFLQDLLGKPFCARPQTFALLPELDVTLNLTTLKHSWWLS